MSQQLIRVAVIGHPITHSLSPVLHRAAFEFLGINGTYDAIEVGPGQLADFFQAEAGNFDYLSITMPLKEEALALKVSMDSLIARVQTANTLYRAHEEWHLTSTDGAGFLEALNVRGNTSFDSVLVLGAGGTARAVVGALDSCSAKVTVLGRTSSRKSALESAVQSSEFEYQMWNEQIDFADYDLVVNTTPAGAADLIADSLTSVTPGLLFEVIYNPWPTYLASRWRDSGGEVISGVEMLLYQGIAQLELVLDETLDHLALAQHLRPILLSAIK
jgi:shikimate dehydrogenase